MRSTVIQGILSYDHFFIKLLHIAKSMNTPSAKAEAERRTEYMYAFLEQLKSEIGQ